MINISNLTISLSPSPSVFPFFYLSQAKDAKEGEGEDCHKAATFISLVILPN